MYFDLRMELFRQPFDEREGDSAEVSAVFALCLVLQSSLQCLEETR